MKNGKRQLYSAISFVLMLTITAVIAGGPVAIALIEVPDRNTGAYLSVNAPLIGMGQPLTVNMWVYPSPVGPTFEGASRAVLHSYENLEITFIKPDGSTDTFLPLDGSADKLGLAPGESEATGSIWFYYYPDQIGTWTAQFSFPGQTWVEEGYSVYYVPAVSQLVTFTVQQDLVRIGFDPVPLPGPNDYWESPINSENREWSVLSGTSFDPFIYNMFNPYTTGPESPHILWKRQVALGGLVGGAWGGITARGDARRPDAIMFGKVFYRTGAGTVACLDQYTGELEWEQPGSISKGEISSSGNPLSTTADNTPYPYYWAYSSSSWTRYAAHTGTPSGSAITKDILVSPGAWLDEDIGYSDRQGGWDTTIPSRLAYNELICFDKSKMSGGNYTKGIVWRVNMKQPDGTGPGEGGRSSSIELVNGQVMVGSPLEDKMYAFDQKTGELTKVIQLPFPNPINPWDSCWIFDSPLMASKFVVMDSSTMKWHCFDTATWQELWVADVQTYPWGSQGGSPSQAYGNVYVCSYDGRISAIDLETGLVEWQFYSGDTTETIFGTWPFRRDCWVADGKIYVGHFEHSPTQPLLRGAKLYCLDAFTGEQIWNLSAWANPRRGVVGGTVIVVNAYDGYMYNIGKGKTETTVEAPLTAVPKGTSVVIRGTVMDMSPAQAGTPAVSDESMTGWMDYLHMQKPMPMDVTGVWVKLTAVKSDGSTIDINTVQSDMAGLYSIIWTPPDADKYTIIAQFDGSKSYWPSYAETALGVTAGPAAAPAFKPLSGPAEAATTDLTLVVAAVAAIAVIAAAVLVLRRRK